MSEGNNNAFPSAPLHVKPDNDKDYVISAVPGLSKREYAAIEIMAGLMANPSDAFTQSVFDASPHLEKGYAAMAVVATDALFDELDKDDDRP